MKVGGLFSGIGGLELGLEWAGFATIWHAEVDPFCSAVLAHHWPDVPNLGDVTTIDWSTVERPDVICGGYPCQPFSLAGKRAGEADPRHLWPHMANAIRTLRPRYAILENVSGHRSLGFGEVLRDLAACGYDAEWDCIPASAVGAHHRRDRVFIVAYPQRDVVRQEPLGVFWGVRQALSLHDGAARPVADADDAGRGRASADAPQLAALERGRVAVADADGEREPGQGGHLAEGGRRAPDDRAPRGGVGAWRADADPWSVEPEVGRVADGVPRRVDRLRALGNAVVPQVAAHVGRRLRAADGSW